MSTKKAIAAAALAEETVTVDAPVMETAKTTVKRTFADPPKETNNQMYLGPTILGVVRHSTVFKGGALPLKVKRCIERLPVMKRLDAPLYEVPKAVRELNRGTSVLDAVCDQVNRAFNGKALF